ncbi:MAG: hypothetical protein ACLFSI_01940 [Halorhodospira sp.]
MPRISGLSMLEALIALGLLSAMAATALHVLLEGVHSARNAAYRAQAVLLAEELIARAHLLPPDQRAAALARVEGPAPREGCAVPPPAARARGDRLALEAWRAELACALPRAEARIEAGPERVKVTLRWQPAGREDAPTEVTLEAAP